VATLFDKIGGDALRAVITDFYERLTTDLMIGFLFQGKDKQRLIDKEWEFTANLLGADVKYSGRPIRTAHARSPIMGGHFERRLQILRETLADHDVDAAVQERWIEHTLALRPQVTGDRGSECDHEVSARRMARSGRALPILGQDPKSNGD
jgi:hemoglobin